MPNDTTDRLIKLLRAFVPKLTQPQIKALRSLADGPKTTRDRSPDAIPLVCGWGLSDKRLATRKEVRGKGYIRYEFTITPLGRTMLELLDMEKGRNG